MDCDIAGVWSRVFSTKSKKSLMFAEIILAFPNLDEEEVHEDSLIDEHIFLISFMDPWYGDIIVYL